MAEFTIHTVAEALAKGQDESVNLAVRVLQAEGTQTYTKKDNTTKSFFTCLVADNTDSAWVRVYQVPKLTTFAPQSHLMLRGLLRKTGEHGLWCVSTTKVTEWVQLQIPQAILDAARNRPKQLSSPVRSLQEAVTASSPSTIVAKVTQASPLKMMRDGSLPTKFLQLVDVDVKSPVKIALFGNEANSHYNQGDVVRITEAFPYMKGQSLSTRKEAKVEFLPAEHIGIDVSNIPLCTDRDFMEDIDLTNDFEVMAVQNVYCYKCCDKPACRNKKLTQENTCPTCRNTPASEQNYGSAMLIIKRNDAFLQMRLFLDNLKKLFAIDTWHDSDILHRTIKDQLPVSARGRFTNSGLEVLTAKRGRDM